MSWNGIVIVSRTVNVIELVNVLVSEIYIVSLVLSLVP
jgi:hypothetical protein